MTTTTMIHKKKNKNWFFFYFFFSSVLCSSSLTGRSAVSSLPSNHLLGVSPQDEKYYMATVMKCKDGSNKNFTKPQLNDNFCDCPGDGADEPGTSACPNGKFFCPNSGHVPLSIYSSRVNDGICDCCDGSDEYDGKIKCPNTCWEAGKVARDRLKKKISVYEEGVALRKQEIEQSKLAAAKDEAELSKLKSEEKILKGLVQQLQDRKEQIDKAEEKERLQKEKERLQEEREEKERKDSEEAQLGNNRGEEKSSREQEPMESYDDKIGLLEDSSSLEDVTVHGNPLNEQHNDDHGHEGSSSQKEEHAAKEEETAVPVEPELDIGSKGEDASDNTESLSREELGRIVGSRWTGKKEEQESEKVNSPDDHEIHEEQPKSTHDEEDDNYDSENEDEHSTYDDDVEDTEDPMEDFAEDNVDTSSSYKYESDDESDLSDISSTSNPSWLEKIQQTVRNILQAVNLFQTPVDKSEAAHVRKEYDELSSKLSKIQTRISSLTQKVKHDFGREKEFYSLYGQCLEIKENKYVYKICPFKQATQEEGHSVTRLGSWDKFDDSYRIMHFSNGDKCWNGPDRSLTVKLRCGLKNEVTDVGEPSRCEYEALLSTPVLCSEEKLEELQDKLDLMNKQQPQGHDEL